MSMNTEKTIIGIGNALMDAVVKLTDDSFLTQCNLPKGSMTHVDAETSKLLNEETNIYEKEYVPGGSVANTIDGLAHLGANASFIGKVGDDEFGEKYGAGLKEVGANPILFKTKTPTGLVMAMITSDSERTFATYLGAAIEMIPEDIHIELFRGYDIAYIEGYLVQNHDLVRKAAEMARKAGLTIAIDLASYNVVEENIDFLKEIIAEYVDIIFANEDEAKVFSGKEPIEALNEFATMCDIAVVKIGGEGSLIKSGDYFQKVGTIGNKCIDSTGAGDLYAAGFLYGFSKRLKLETCAKIGSITAGNVITVYGARMNDEMWKSINESVNNLINE